MGPESAEVCTMGDMHDVLQQLMQQQQMVDPQEIHRLRLLHDSALKQLQKVNSDRDQSQIESAKGKDNEKLGERLRKQWTYSQFASLSFALLAIILLVWLAIANFSSKMKGVELDV